MICFHGVFLWRYGYTQYVHYMLLAEDVDITVRGPEGATCLHIAAQAGHLDLVKLLLAYYTSTVKQATHRY